MSIWLHQDSFEEYYGKDLKPTQKQIDYAEKLAEMYEVDLSQIPFTRADYSEFIDTFKDM